MPTYAFKCDQCGTVDAEVEMSVDEYVDHFWCGALPDCGGVMRRHFAGHAPAVSRVKGAGGSPYRPAT